MTRIKLQARQPDHAAHRPVLQSPEQDPALRRVPATSVALAHPWGAAPRARAAQLAQRSIGNARLGRAASTSAEAERPAGDAAGLDGKVMRDPLPPGPGGAQAAAAPSCQAGPGIQAPDAETLKQRLVTYGVLRPGAVSTDFASILHRHVTLGTPIGADYLQYLRDQAYPMGDFCITYRGGGWNVMFRDVLRSYGASTPRHRATQGVRASVESYARERLFVIDVNLMYPGGQRDPFVGPLTPRTIERRPRGALLSGEAPEAVLLLLATDRFLSSLTLSAAAVSRTTPAPASSGATSAESIFGWGTSAQEGTRGDPNRFDDLIVHWVDHYNRVFLPLDRHGNPNPLDPDLFKALIYRESRFDEAAASSESSARGMTQVLSRERRTAADLTAGISGVTDAAFANPGLQIATGVRILFEKYGRSRDWRTAVRDYNGGRRRDQYAREVWSIYTAHRRGAAQGTGSPTPQIQGPPPLR